MHSTAPLTGDSFAFRKALARWLNPVLSAIGALFGMAGTGVLAFELASVSTVLALYAISNVAWISVAFRTRQWWLLAMNGVYLSLSVFGLLR